MQDVSSLPIVAQLTFDEDGQTLAGVHAREAVERLGIAGRRGGRRELRPRPAGGPGRARRDEPGANGLPLTAQPNVGLPSRSGGRIVYPHATPDYFAEFAAQARSRGAGMIGGCCGTTPAQIAAIRAAVEEGASRACRSS